MNVFVLTFLSKKTIFTAVITVSLIDRKKKINHQTAEVEALHTNVCDCGERQTMSHLITCGDAPNCTWYANHCQCQLCQTLGGIYLTVTIEYSMKKTAKMYYCFQRRHTLCKLYLVSRDGELLGSFLSCLFLRPPGNPSVALLKNTRIITSTPYLLFVFRQLYNH